MDTQTLIKLVTQLGPLPVLGACGLALLSWSRPHWFPGLAEDHFHHLLIVGAVIGWSLRQLVNIAIVAIKAGWCRWRHNNAKQNTVQQKAG